MSHARVWKKYCYHYTLESLYKQGTSNKKGTVIDNFIQW